MSERADGNSIDAGFGKVANIGERDSAGGFDRDAVVGIARMGAGYGLAREIGSEIVEENGIGALGQGFIELGNRVDFNFDPSHCAAICLRGADGGRDAASQAHVIFLYEDRVIEAKAMICAATGADGVLFERAQAGRGFARIENRGAGSGDGVNVRARERGDAAQSLKQIESDAFGAEQRLRAAANPSDDLAGRDAIAIAAENFVFEIRIEQAKRFEGEIEARQNERAFGYELAGGALLGANDGFGCTIALTDVFVEKSTEEIAQGVSGKGRSVHGDCAGHECGSAHRQHALDRAKSAAGDGFIERDFRRAVAETEIKFFERILAHVRAFVAGAIAVGWRGD